MNRRDFLSTSAASAAAPHLLREIPMGKDRKLKKSLKKLADVGDSPAKQLAEAMKSGDLKEAEKAIRDLADKLKNGKLTNTEKKALAKDLQKIADQLDKMAQEHEKEKQEPAGISLYADGTRIRTVCHELRKR